MSGAERILAARLLRLAADSFANHGCNDMDEQLLEEVSPSDRAAMESSFNQWNCPDGATEDRIPFRHIGDSSWMAYLADQLESLEVA